MYAFQSQDSSMTLAEGLAELYARTPQLKRESLTSAQARAFFQSHDAAHVVFGCDVTLTQEAVVKLSSIFGTTGGWGVLRGYALYDSLDIYRKLALGDVLATLAASVVIAPRTILRCLRQKKPWPWTEFESLLAEPLGDLRSEFGIKV